MPTTCYYYGLSVWQVLSYWILPTTVPTHFTIRKQGHTANNRRITSPIWFQIEALHHTVSQLKREKTVKIRSLRDSIYSSGRRRAASKEEEEQNIRRMWYKEARCTEFPPKIKEYFFKSCWEVQQNNTTKHQKERSQGKDRCPRKEWLSTADFSWVAMTEFRRQQKNKTVRVMRKNKCQPGIVCSVKLSFKKNKDILDRSYYYPNIVHFLKIGLEKLEQHHTSS